MQNPQNFSSFPFLSKSKDLYTSLFKRALHTSNQKNFILCKTRFFTLEHFECPPNEDDLRWHQNINRFISIAQWNFFWGFVSLWKCRPTTWFPKIGTFSPMNWVFFQSNWLYQGLETQLSWKKTQFMCENVKNLQNHVDGRRFHNDTKLWKTFHCVNSDFI